MSKGGTKAKQSAREKHAKRLARAVVTRGPILHNRLVSVSVRSECDTNLYIIALKRTTHSPPFLLAPVLVAEGDMVYVNMEALTKGSYDRVTLRRTMRSIGDYRPCTKTDIYTLAQYGATGLVMGLKSKRDRTATEFGIGMMAKVRGPAWWDSVQAKLVAKDHLMKAQTELEQVLS